MVVVWDYNTEKYVYMYIYMDSMGLSENKTQKTPLVNHCIPGSRAINFGGMKNPQHLDIV